MIDALSDGDCDSACRVFLRQVGQSALEFDDQGVAAFVSSENHLVRLEKGEAGVLFLEVCPAEGTVSMNSIPALLRRANLRTRPPFPFHVCWMPREAGPRLVVRFEPGQADEASLLASFSFALSLVG